MRIVPVLALIGCIQPTVPNPVDDSGDTEPDDAVDLRVLGFNVESGDADPDTIAGQIDVITGEAIWGFSEVMSYAWAETFAAAAAVGEDDVDFQIVFGTTGYQDRLVIVYDAVRLDLLDSEELHDINVGGTARAPLVARFRVRANDRDFLFMNNHLWRSEWGSRQEQARLLHAWAEEQSLPTIAVGDYNFDWDPVDGDSDHDGGYDLMTDGGVWEWVRPEELFMTQCSGGVLDFVFVAGEAREWPAESKILFPDPGYCHDTELTSDHRPVSAVFTVPGG